MRNPNPVNTGVNISASLPKQKKGLIIRFFRIKILSITEHFRSAILSIIFWSPVAVFYNHQKIFVDVKNHLYLVRWRSWNGWSWGRSWCRKRWRKRFRRCRDHQISIIVSFLISSFTHVLNFLIIAENLSVRKRKSQLKLYILNSFS